MPKHGMIYITHAATHAVGGPVIHDGSSAISIGGGFALSFSSTSTQNLILTGNGRISTGTAAGSTCNIDATTSAYGQGLELRYAVTDWADTYTLTEGTGMYLRMENQESNNAASIYGTQIYGVSNNVANTQYLWGALVYAYVKGAAGLTCSGIYGIQPEITFDAATASSTITDAAIVRAKLTGGTMSDYTVLDGYRLTLGDMNGGSRTYGNGLLLEDDSGMSGTCSLTTGINITIGCTTGIDLGDSCTTAIGIGTCATGISFTGTYTGNCIDFTNDTIDYTGSSGPAYIRAGTYGSPITNADEDQSGFLRLYGSTTADGSSYDRGVFMCLTTTGTKGIFPIAGLAEVREQTGDGPAAVMASQFICHMNSATAKLANSTGVQGMYAGWFKITANEGATCGATSKKAAVWLDNQMYGNNAAPGEEYTIFATTGGLKPDAFIGFETTSSGWSNFLYFDETAYDQDPIASATISGGTQDLYLKVSINGTAYGIALYAI